MANRYWVGGTGTWDAANTTNWSTASGGAGGASVPTSADIVFIDADSGGGTITLGADANIIRLDARGSTVNVDWNSYKIAINGSGTTVWYSGGITATGSSEAKVEFTYTGANNRTITPRSGVGENSAISVYVTAGIGNFTISTGSTGVLQNLNFTGFSGTLVPTSGGASWTIYGDLTLSATMTMPTMNGAFLLRGVTATRTVTANGKTFNQPVTVNAPANTIKFAEALTCTTFSLTSGTAEFEAGTTNTATTFVLNGNAIQSSLPGTQYTLSQASGTVNANNTTITDSNATGGATWNAFISQGNIDGGNNTGWDFLVQVGRYMYTRRKNKVILQS
jgi:hypothetical protein